MQRFAFLAVLVGLLMLPGCKPEEPNTLKIGVLPITDVVPMYVAQHEGYFVDEGIEVELIPVASGPERDSMIQAGVIDGQLNEILTTVLTNAGAGEQVRIVTTARKPFPNAPMFYVLSSPSSGITTPDGLKGIEIGISSNTVIEYVTERVLQKAGLSDDEIRSTNIPKIPVRLELLLSDQIQAGVLPDPLASLSQLQGANLVIDDTTYPEVSLSVISFRESVLTDRPGTAKAFLKAYDRAVAAINEDPQKFQNILIETARVPEVLQDRYELPPFPEKELPSESQVEDVVEWALGKGLIDNALAYDQLVSTTFRR